MEQNPNKPKQQPQTSVPPPRPPRGPAISLSAGDGGDDPGHHNHNDRKKETVRINLPPKPSAAPTFKPSTLPAVAALSRRTILGIEKGLIIGGAVAGLIAVGTTIYCLTLFTPP